MSAENTTIDQAIACHAKGQLDEALKLYVQALQINPRNQLAADLISAIGKRVASPFIGAENETSLPNWTVTPDRGHVAVLDERERTRSGHGR